jgi:hypothetical protein
MRPTLIRGDVDELVSAAAEERNGVHAGLSFAMSMGSPADGCCQGDGTTPVASRP